MSTPDEQRHTLFLLQGKGYDRGVWEVDVGLIDDWLKAVERAPTPRLWPRSGS